jgi:hypothetical protein
MFCRTIVLFLTFWSLYVAYLIDVLLYKVPSFIIECRHKKYLYSHLTIQKIKITCIYKVKDRNTVSSSDPLHKSYKTRLLNTLNNTPYTAKERSPTRKQLSTNGVKWNINNTTTHNIYKTAQNTLLSL